MAQQQTQLPDAILSEVWTMMHLAVASDIQPHCDKGCADSKVSQYGDVSGHVMTEFVAEGHVDTVDDMESDSPLDGNANEGSVGDMQALKEAAEILAVIGDSFDKTKDAENKLIDDLVQCLQIQARNIDQKLERELCRPVPPSNIFQETLVSAAYGEVKTRLETFLVGEEGFNKIAMVTHITKGISTALRTVSAPAVSLAAALSYRFVTEEYGDLILQSGGLRNLVTSNSQ